MGIMPYSDDGRMDPGDNGIYVIEGWRIADRILPYEGFVEQSSHDFDGMLRAFDEAMPEGERLGDLLDAEEVPASELEIGDEVWCERLRRTLGALPRGCPLRKRHAARRPIRSRRRLELEPEQQDRIRNRPHRPEGVGVNAKGAAPSGGSLPIVIPIAIAPGLRARSRGRRQAPLHPIRRFGIRRVPKRLQRMRYLTTAIGSVVDFSCHKTRCLDK